MKFAARLCYVFKHVKSGLTIRNKNAFQEPEKLLQKPSYSSKSSITITELTTVQSIFQTPHIYHLLPSFKVLPDNSLEKWDRQKYRVSLKYLTKEMLKKKKKKRQMLRPHPRPIPLETLGVGRQKFVFKEHVK